MHQFLNKLRAKPLHERKMIALGISLGVTSVLALIWFASLSVRFGNTTQTANITQSSNDSSSQFQTIMSGFGQMVNNAQKALNDAKNAVAH